MESEPSSELWKRLERARTAIDPGLSDRDVERLVSGARRLGRRRAGARRALAAAALVLLGGTSAATVCWKTTAGRGPMSEATTGSTTASTAETTPGSTDAPVRGETKSQATSPAARPASAPPLTQASGPSTVERAVRSPAGAAPPPSERAAARAVRLQDGSVAIPMDDGTELTLRESSERRVAIDLERGRGRFEVTPRGGRTFSVRAGAVSVTVLGTIFTVERIADRIGVGVERGRVLVDWGTGSTRLGAGESGWFPPLLVDPRSAQRPAHAARSLAAAPPSRATVAGTSAGAAAAAEPSEAAEPSQAAIAALPAPPSVGGAAAIEPSPEPRTSASPLPLAGAAEPGSASAPNDRSTADTMEALLAAADAARLAGRATEATARLRRAVTLHPTDGRAPLAAFTLGRMLLVKLGAPREAAAAFAQARHLAPEGPLAEDALAREVEAWAGASDRAQAHDRAAEYLRRYPAGRRVRTVRAFGGLE